MCSTVLCLRNIRGILKRKVAHITFPPISGCAKLAIQIQIQVKHRRKYKSQDHQAGRWQHSCAWQRIIQPWALITAQLSTVGVISPESFIPGEQLWKLFPYSLKKSFGSDQLVPFLWNCLHREHCRQG